MDIEKGGVGSGRHKNSIPELEDSNFDPKIEERHKEEAERITNRPQELEREMVNVNGRIKQKKGELAKFEKERFSLLQQGMVRTNAYHKIEGVIKKIGDEGKELYKQLRALEKEYNELNH
jgi:chromosome segregation ATPase